MRVLVAGWFSFEKCNVTAGDLMARDITCEWLEQAGHPYDVALVPPFTGGINWRSVDPTTYSHVVFVCGPFPYIEYSVDFLQHFSQCRLIGLDLSMIESVENWNPFDTLIERDSCVATRPDISFGFHQTKVPIVGVILVHPQHEYKEKSKHQIANEAIYRLISSQEMVAVPIDTGLDPNTTNLRTAAEVESLIARMDLVVTTRLHGTVLALKNSIPVIAIDAISGGAKVTRQAKTIGWDLVYSVDNLSDYILQEAFAYCKTEAARIKARECCYRARQAVEQVRNEFLDALEQAGASNSRIWRDEMIDKSLVKKPVLTTQQKVIASIRPIKKKIFLGLKTILRE